MLCRLSFLFVILLALAAIEAAIVKRQDTGLEEKVPEESGKVEAPASGDDGKKEEAKETPASGDDGKKEEAKETPASGDDGKKVEAKDEPSSEDDGKKVEAKDAPSSEDDGKKVEAKDAPSSEDDGKEEEAEDAKKDGKKDGDKDGEQDAKKDDGWKETVILLKKQTLFGQNVFIRGGVGNAKNCAPDKKPEDDPCAVPIKHLDLNMASDTTARDDAVKGDNYLTWGGAEEGQEGGDGTPAQWTRDDVDKDFYSDLNSYGEHYWLVRVKMDCSKLPDGFFDFKGYLSGNWEEDISSSICSGEGDAAKKPQYTSTNHIGRCGYINVFEWGRSSCTYKEIK